MWISAWQVHFTCIFPPTQLSLLNTRLSVFYMFSVGYQGVKLHMYQLTPVNVF